MLTARTCLKTQLVAQRRFTVTASSSVSRGGHNMASIKVLKLKDLSSRYSTVLSFDGGGLRGLFTVTLMESLVQILKEELVKLAHDPSGRYTLYQAGDDQQTPVLPQSAAEFDIDIGDFFDTLSGTSTGSIVATYFSARGKGIKKEYLPAASENLQIETNKLRSQTTPKNAEVPVFSELRTGSILAGQAVYLYACSKIFAPREWWATCFNWATGQGQGSRQPLKLFQQAVGFFLLPALIGVRAILAPSKFGKVLDNCLDSKYSAAGLNGTLYDVFEDMRLSQVGGCMLIPTYQLGTADPLVGAMRPFSFLHTNHLPRNVINGDSAFGYTSIARLMTTSELAQADQSQRDVTGHKMASPSLDGTRVATDLVFAFNNDFFLRDIVRASAAAPTFFPPAEVTPVEIQRDGTYGYKKDGPTYYLCDGGVAANDPAPEAVVFTSIVHGGEKPLPLKDVAVLSLGTGAAIATGQKPMHFSGYFAYGMSLISILMSAAQDLSTALLAAEQFSWGQKDTTDYVQGQVSRVQLTCQYNPDIRKAPQETADGWADFAASLDGNSRLVADVWLPHPYDNSQKPRRLGDILSEMDDISAKWWLYHIGQVLGQNSRVQQIFRNFVRNFVLCVPAEPEAVETPANGASAPEPVAAGRG